MQFVDEFEDDTFWDKLCSELARRDLIDEKGLENAKNMDPLDRFREEDKFAAKYHQEFERNGIKNLILSKT